MRVPKIRLNGFLSEWMIAPLKHFAKKSTEKNSANTYTETFTNSAEHGVISQRDFFDHDISNQSNISGYYIIHPNHFVYNPRVSVTAPVGPINKNNLDRSGVMSPLYLIFSVDGIDKEYLAYFFKTKLWHKYMLINGNCGARFDRLSISDDLFMAMPITIPCDPTEQVQIAEYFKTLDSLIEAKTKKIASLKQTKQACLQSLFPQPGETKPRIRFNGFASSWEKRPLSDCLEISNETNIDNKYCKEDVLSVSDEVGVVNQIKHLGRSFAGKSVTNYGVLKTGQIVYTKSPLKSKPFGIIKQNLGDTGIVSVLYAVYDVKEGVDAGYIHYYFDPAWRLNNYIRPLVNKGAKNTMNISDETALEGYITIPSLAEQQKIASFFINLDKQIALYEQGLEKLKNVKKACLDSMFV